MSGPATVTVNEAVTEALDAIGDDPEYATARQLLHRAECLLADGTTEQATAALNEALAELERVCPI
ncbi:hypothetical protein ACWDBD_17335 [Streptomyces sp. NPDC001118]